MSDSFSTFDFAARRSVLVAASGGSDSTALLLLLKAWLAEHAPRTRLVAATVDHDLRQGSAEEAASVARLAARIGIAHLTLVWQGEKPGAGLPAAAREARYGLLAQAASRIGTDIIATGHTADDQAETVLMRKTRGEGRGLSGMAPATLLAGRHWIVRPLLGERREALRGDLRAAGIGWLDDPTNINPSFERARRRADMREADLAEALETAARSARQREALARAAAGLIRSCAAMPAPGLVRLDRRMLGPSDADAAVHALRVLLAAIGGTPHLADAARVEAVAGKLGAPTFRTSISRCLVAARRDGIWLCREARGLPPPRPACDGMIWDGRYRVSAGPGAADCLIAPSGSAGAGMTHPAGNLPAGPVRTALSGQPAFLQGEGRCYLLRHGSEGQRDVSDGGPREPEGWTATPVLAPWSRFLPGFDLDLARAVAALLVAPPIPDSPWHGHIVTRA
ncbi:MAG: tRNA lysidine(34) synthetase TilS [Rhizobiaceae bacterium]|nr:tRNA lysidine(34) synthetase TilS [Rhizobiaceae bacterium]